MLSNYMPQCPPLLDRPAAVPPRRPRVGRIFLSLAAIGLVACSSSTSGPAQPPQAAKPSSHSIATQAPTTRVPATPGSDPALSAREQAFVDALSADGISIFQHRTTTLLDDKGLVSLGHLACSDYYEADGSDASKQATVAGTLTEQYDIPPDTARKFIHDAVNATLCGSSF